MTTESQCEKPFSIENSGLRFVPVEQLPLVQPGDNLGERLASAIVASGIVPIDENCLIVTHKIVSRAERRLVDLSRVTPSDTAQEIAERTGRPAEFVQVVLDESQKVLEVTPASETSRGMIVTRHKLGHVCTNAGVDKTKPGQGEKNNWVVLLPENPDQSAANIAAHLEGYFKVRLGVAIIDTMGDPHRLGAIGKTIGVANLPSRLYYRSEAPLGETCKRKIDLALADSLAAPAMLLMDQPGKLIPACLVAGLRSYYNSSAGMVDLIK